MLHNDEKKIINLIKLWPLFIIAFSILITLMIFKNNSIHFENEMKIIKEESINHKKSQIKREVQRVYRLIKDEKKIHTEKMKENIKNRVYEAYSIINSIYKQNRNKSDQEIKKIIKDALKEIRFNKGKGYYFIYELSSRNILLPLNKELEEENLWKLLSKEKKEGFYTWHNNKQNSNEKESEKIAYVKLFKYFNWIIGTQEYIIEYEKDLKRDLLKKIHNIRYGENGYFFVIDEKGIYLSHYKKSYIGKNRINLEDVNGFKITQEAIKTATKGEGFISYIGTIQPSTGKAAQKITFVKGLKDWKWGIGTGVYISDIEYIINKKRNLLKEKNKNQLFWTIIISVIVFLVLFIFSLFLAKNIKDRFLKYKQNVEDKTLELNYLNEELELKVEERTKNLNYLNIKLKDTIKDLSKTKKDLITAEDIEQKMETKAHVQSKNLNYINKKLKDTVTDLLKTKKDLIIAEKMSTLGELVSSMTHEINSPLGVCITSASHLADESRRLITLHSEDKLTEKDFKNLTKSIEEISESLSLNLNNAKNLVSSFNNVAVDQATEDIREFNLKEYIHEILLALKSKTKKTNIDILVECEDNLIIKSYPGYLSQILTNFINNSILHGFVKNQKGTISIIINNFKDNIELIYSDNGKGIPIELKNRIFDQYFTTKKGSGGTGLGLYIVKEIVTEKLNGSIKINSSEKKGINFLISIPKISRKDL